MPRLPVLIALALLSLRPAFPAPVTISGRQLAATFADGCLVDARNLATGERYFTTTAPQPLVGLTGRPGLLPAARVLGRGAVPGGYRWVAETQGPDPARVTTTVRVEEATGGITVEQQVSRPVGGIAGVQWGWRGLDLRQVRLLLPAAGGVVVDPARTERQVNYEWPGSWQAAALFVQGRRGGLWLWTQDSRRCFKDLRYQGEGGVATLAFAAQTDGRPSLHRQFSSVTWHLAAYQGNWQGPAARYRALMEASYRLTPLARRRPAWLAQVRFVVRGEAGLTPADLERLAREVPPTRTLIYLPDWRTLGYDVNYPEYTPRPEVVAWVRQARSLGFHVLAHFNFAGLNPRHPLRLQYEDMLQHDRWSGELVGWYLDRPQDPQHQIVVLNPAYPQARRLLVERIAAAQRELGCDAVHLDFPVLINTASGRAGGLNPLGGAELYLRELQQAMPEVALGTEGTHEILLPCSFVQLGEIFWNQGEHLGTYHPVRSFLFSPYVYLYGHLGMPEPTSALPAFTDATLVGLRLAGLPTLPLPYQPVAWQADGVQLALELGRAWAEHDLQPDFTLREGEAMAWRGKGGYRLSLRRDATGWVLAAPDRPLLLVAEGANELPAPWTVPGWPAQDARGVFALDPGRRYLALARPPAPTALALERPPQPLVLQGYCAGEQRAYLSLARPTRVVWQARAALGQATTFVLAGGRRHPLGGGASFTLSSAPGRGERREGIFAHPPWQGAVAGGATVGEFALTLPPAERLTLQFATGLGDLEANPTQPAGDGATFSVSVNGRRLFTRHHPRGQGWQPAQVDLTGLAGRRLVLRLVTEPGPARDVSYDWAYWNDVRIVVQPHSQGELACAVVSDRAAPVTVPPAERTGSGPYRYRFRAPGPGLFAGLLFASTPVSLPARLADLPYSAAVMQQGLGHDGSVFGSGTINPALTLGGQALRALGGHTPAWGRTHLDWALRLPATPCRLRFHYGVVDGGESVVFLVLVNGEPLWQQAVPHPAGWQQAELDLGRWAGQPVLLGLVTDADGSNNCDWAHWGEPALEPVAGAGAP